MFDFMLRKAFFTLRLHKQPPLFSSIYFIVLIFPFIFSIYVDFLVDVSCEIECNFVLVF